MAFLSFYRIPSYDSEELKRAVSGIMDRSGLSFSGRRVLVKPNLLGPFPPGAGVTTHPEVVRAVREELKRRGAEVLVGDNPGVRGYGMVKKVGRVTGMEGAAGEDFVNLSERPKMVSLSSRYVDKVSISSEIEEVDLLVSLPKLKTHMGTVITAAVKNSYGFIVGADKARLHAAAPRPSHFGELVVDIYALRPPDLVILDAVVGMDGNGPSGGRLRDIGLLVGSDSGGVADLAVCRMAGIDPEKVPTQAAAARRGLAPGSLHEVDLDGEIPRVEDFKTPSNFLRFDFLGVGQKLIFSRISRPKFRVDPSSCEGCGICERGCPAGAIKVNGLPVFDRKKCIGCYCCYELCPCNALTVGGVMRYLRRGGTGDKLLE